MRHRPSPPRHRHRTIAALVALVLLLAASLSCNSDDHASDPASTTVLSTPTGAAPGDVPSGDPSVTVVNVVQACREKDGDRLRSFVAVTVPDADVQALFERGTDVRLESQTLPEIEGDRATVAVRLEIRRDGEQESVDRDWELQRDDDGVWRLTSLPDCF